MNVRSRINVLSWYVALKRQLACCNPQLCSATSLSVWMCPRHLVSLCAVKTRDEFVCSEYPLMHLCAVNKP